MPESLGARLHNRLTGAYGLAHFGKSLFWHASEILFAFYLTEIAMLAPSSMGLVLAAGFFTGAILDLVISAIIRNHLHESSQALRLQWIGAICASVSLVVFLSSALVPSDYRFGLAIISGMAFRIFYVLYDLPQNVLMSVATSQDRARSLVSNMRLFYSGISGVTLALCVGPMLTHHTGLIEPLRYLLLALVVSVIGLFTSWNLKNCASPVTSVPAFTNATVIPAGLPSRVLIPVFMLFITSALVSTFNKAEPYYARFVLQSPLWGGTVIVAASVGLGFSQFLWFYLAKRQSETFAMQTATLLLALSACGFWVFAANPLIAILCACGVGAGNGGLTAFIWSNFSQRVIRFAPRKGAFAFATLTAWAKFGLGIGALALGSALHFIDYRHTQAHMIVVVMTLPVILAAVLIIIVEATSRRT